MSLFHTHRWREVRRYFNDPKPTHIRSDYEYPELLAFKLLHGYTVIVMQCDTCGDMKTLEAVGDARSKP